ncbi:MAG: YbaK/EbsC family protein [Deltaproteobacteria bacterium]|nr:YbaK/EbsC family protein [Deltaproteobacteria bacterium]MBW2152102.1 YbaK/EbsC family protein [Deltaproteobacteria bacterium]
MKTAITEKLDILGVTYKIKHHSQPVYTSEAAARERGVRLSQIVKTMLLSDRKGKLLVAVLPGDRRLSLKKLKRLAGVKDLSFLDRETIEQRLGLVAGAIAPIAELFKEMPIFVDPSVFLEQTVDISSGDPCAGLELTSKDLKRLLKGCKLVDITL